MQSAGLTSAQAAQYLASHGYNEIPEKKQSLWVKVAKKSATPISAMLVFAALLSFVSGKDFDGVFILSLLVLNVAVSVWQEHKADTAIEKLNENLSVPAAVLRDNVWHTIPSRELVPHDLIKLKAGDVIPADARATKAVSASVNEAALTGESLPKDKVVDDTLYSGSFVASGLMEAEITATGANTYFGKTLAKVDTTQKKSSLERDILRISRFLSVLSILAVAILTLSLAASHAPWVEIMRLDLSLVIAGIPVSLPTVMTLIIAFGVVALAKKNVVVRRLSSLEELANTDFLLTDKTGTLTKNEITVNEVLGWGDVQGEEVLRLATVVAAQEPDTLINRAILTKGGTPPTEEAPVYVPGDSVRKRSTLTLGDKETLTLGAPQIVAGLCTLFESERAKFDGQVAGLAARGYRTITLARTDGTEEKNMKLCGILTLSDILREDAKGVVEFLQENGIGISMVTGDNRAIAGEIAGKLAIPGDIVTKEALEKRGIEALTEDDFKKAATFAEILPEDKYELVKAAKKYYTVAANGDGVNDLPAVREASVGFAVKNAVEALRGAADIVLLTDGIAVMRDAFIEGRKIFARLYSYSLYRISESFRLIVTIVILGLLTGTYPLSPLQIILIALLNDIPIISLAFDRVKVAHRPSKIRVSQQFTQSTLFGLVGVVNSMLLYWLAIALFHLPLPIVQTLFFLKLTVSGHLLIYVAHTRERWWKFLPSSQVIWATMGTQAVATLIAVSGFFMPAAISWGWALFIWIWAFAFMQAGELVKWIQEKIEARGQSPAHRLATEHAQ